MYRLSLVTNNRMDEFAGLAPNRSRRVAVGGSKHEDRARNLLADPGDQFSVRIRSAAAKDTLVDQQRCH